MATGRVIGGALLGGGVESINSMGHALAVNTAGAPGKEVVPQVSSVDTSFVSLGAVADIFGFRVAIDSSDDTDASNRLADGNPGVGQAGLGQTLVFNMDTAVTRVDVVGLANLDTESGTITVRILRRTATLSVAQRIDFQPSSYENIIAT